MATAQVLLQRFYYVSSLKQFPLRDTMLACLFLASKLEEAPRKIRDVINVFDYLIKRKRGQPVTPLEAFSQTFYDFKNGLTVAELQLLKRLAFNVQVELPYALLVNYLRCLQLSGHPVVPQRAWNYLNDALRTPVYVCYQPPTLACAAIYLAARFAGVALPAQPAWWTVFACHEGDLVTVAGYVLSLYHTPPPADLPLTLAELETYRAHGNDGGTGSAT
ncbi:hypothetical protein IWQ60_006910 [Tieghemiomyces parasiticus]|uniref:Cyclin-like domain-containing protein n=1 Tax=Tieghemiomyces parasiticus TaxID=78921 RepID=A0A9W8A1B3_9FUNG|nr:hypothetical protein IWQ60_006910 [Tieghemiomyces parasiticus]